MSDLSRDRKHMLPVPRMVSTRRYICDRIVFMSRIALAACLCFSRRVPHGRGISRSHRRRLRGHRFSIHHRRKAAATESALHHHRHAGEERRGRGDQRRADHARHRRQRARISLANLRRPALRRGPTARRHQILHHPAGRYRPRKIQQAERWAAHEVPALHVHGHGARRVPAGDRETRGESSARWSWGLRWAPCTPGCGARCIPTSWTR